MGFFQGRRLRRQQVRSLDVILPPMAIPTTSANAIWNAMHQHPFAKKVMTLKKYLLQRADCKWDIHSIGAASGNLRLEALDFNIADEDVCKGHVLCRSHQNHIIHISMIGAVFGMPFVNDLFATSMFHRMGCHFMRARACVRRYVEQRLVIKKGAPPAQDALCSSELEDENSG